MSTAFVECWKCDECGHRWIKTEVWPSHCASSKCRKRSWNKLAVSIASVEAVRSGRVIASREVHATDGGKQSDYCEYPPVESKPDIAVLREICAGKLHLDDALGISGHGSGLANPCPKTGFNETDGETYRCSLAKGHKPPCRPGERV